MFKFAVQQPLLLNSCVIPVNNSWVYTESAGGGRSICGQLVLICVLAR